MKKLSFEDLEFENNKEGVRVIFLKNYYFDITKEELEKISEYKINKNSIEFKEKNPEKRFNFLINKGFPNLKSITTNKKTIYLHQNLNIPLIGLSYIGLIDRNTNLIEVKPNNGCNFNCVYCSIDEGISSKRQVDFVIEKDFLVQELKKLIEEKNNNEIEIYINPHGEPLLYEPLVELIKDIKKIKQVKRIGMSTNGLLLTKEKVDELTKAGLEKFNISLNSIDEKTAKIMAGRDYNNKHIINICKHIAKKAQLFIAPVWVPSYNDKEIPKIIELNKTLNGTMCIQNFLNYKFGRNPVKQKPFEKFFQEMKQLEKTHSTKLIVDADDFKVIKTEQLWKPFKKNSMIQADILFQGRLKGEK